MSLRACLLVLTATAFSAVGASAAGAATFTVNTTDDDVTAVAGNCQPGSTTNCSLRDAVAAANAASSPSSSPDTINIPAGTYTLNHGPLHEIDDNVNIVATDPGGATTTTVSGGTDFSGSVFRIGGSEDFAPTVSISGLTITRGSLDDTEGGAGISVIAGTLTLTDSEVTGNTSSSDAKGGGGILNEDTLILDRDAIVSNIAQNGSGAAGIYNRGDATIRDTTISGNNNTSNVIQGSSAGLGGGIFNDRTGLLTLVNDTIVNNTGPGAGGLYVATPNTPSPRVDIQNTILAGNQETPEGQLTAIRAALRAASSNSPRDCGFGEGGAALALTDKGNNSDSDSLNSCAFSALQHDLVSIDPMLGPLSLNGGTTNNHLPQSGSPVIDAGSNVNCPALDQRRLGRPSGASCEIGADEVQVAAPPATTTTPAPQVGVQAAHVASPTVRLTGVPSACVRRAITVHVRVTTTVALSRGSLTLDGNSRSRSRSTSYVVHINAAKLRSGRHHLHATATNPAGTGTASAAFTRCAPIAHHQPRFTG